MKKKSVRVTRTAHGGRGKTKPRARPSINETSVATWFERDRAHVELVDARGNTIFELWDEAVQEAVDDGFLDPRKGWHRAAYDYAIDQGLI